MRISNRSQKQGVILLNLGTPNQPQPPEVKAYLKEFLMDPYVLDIPYLFRWFLVNLAILPKRSVTSAAAYQKVWTERGSPLLVHLNELSKKVQTSLGKSWNVQPAMRYGNPSIESVFKKFKEAEIEDILLFPLYPQYSLAATQSSIEKCLEVSKRIHPASKIRIIEPFYDHELFIQSFTEVAAKSIESYPYDHLLFSFHGLPERHVKKTDSTGNHCLSKNECCSQMTSANQNCYRAQCYSSARLIAEKLGLAKDHYTVCFQSRLGKTPWIQPFTDHFYRELPKRGVKRLAVMCPAFVSDCLETLEEVQIRGREEFIHNGGEDLKLIPSLNSEDIWADAVSQIIQAKTE
jgi:protoporphyrin/coproporphyrin ferrochelatase